MHTERYSQLYVERRVSLEDALLIAERCFGQLGRKTVALWQRYNASYFDGALRPTPVLYVPTSPYGHWVGCTVFDKNIYLMFPKPPQRTWGFVRGVLLHEMVHQWLAQCGRNSKHSGTPWCEEIMRISGLLGRNIWAGKYTVKKIDGKSVRANESAPSSFTSDSCRLNQGEIARWPYSIGIEPPDVTTEVSKGVIHGSSGRRA